MSFQKTELGTLVFTLESSDFFSIGRTLQRAIGKSLLGEVTLSICAGVLTISSRWGGGEIPCMGGGEVTVVLKSKAYCSLVTSRFREKSPSGPMKIVFRPALKEVAVAGVGVKAKF